MISSLFEDKNGVPTQIIWCKTIRSLVGTKLLYLFTYLFFYYIFLFIFPVVIHEYNNLTNKYVFSIFTYIPFIEAIEADYVSRNRIEDAAVMVHILGINCVAHVLVFATFIRNWREISKDLNKYFSSKSIMPSGEVNEPFREKYVIFGALSFSLTLFVGLSEPSPLSWSSSTGPGTALRHVYGGHGISFVNVILALSTAIGALLVFQACVGERTEDQ